MTSTRTPATAREIWNHLPARLLGAAVPSVLLLASIAKAFDFAGFRVSLQSYSLIPDQLRAPAAVAILCLEVLPFSLLLIGSPRQANMIAAAILCIFSAAVCYEMAIGRTPTCNCLGVLQQYLRFHNDAGTILLRNAVLLGLAMIASRAPPLNRSKA